MNGDKETFGTQNKRVVIVSGPVGFSPGEALFAEGVEVSDEDILVAIERPGNTWVEVIDEEA